MPVEPLGHQRHPDQEQETQRQHLDGRVCVDEPRYGPRREHHHPHSDNDGCDHHGDPFGHADGGDNRVQRKDEVEQQDLDDDAGERGGDAFSAVVVTVTFELVVNLVGTLAQQEEPAKDQDEVAPGDGLRENLEERFGETHDPGQ